MSWTADREVFRAPAALDLRNPIRDCAPAADPACELSVVLPCLNESETIAICVRKAMRAVEQAGLSAEVIVADNGSTDGSQAIASSLGARVVNVPVRGYGAALRWGIDAARGKYIIMADSDDSYDLSNLMPFLDALRAGNDLVMGNRFRGGIAPGAMPLLHKYLGNPVLSGFGRLLFATPARDFHCGMRGFTKAAAQRMHLCSNGMEFASEMVVKATIQQMRVVEIPTTLAPDGRSRPPHLRSWRDGWRHLRFLLLYSPRFVFLFPGAVLSVVGAVAMLWLLRGPEHVGRVTFDVTTLLFTAVAVLIGVQAILFWTFAKVFASHEHLLPPDERLDRLFRYVNLEVGIVLGLLLFAAGLSLAVTAVVSWSRQGFGPLSVDHSMRLAIPAMLFLILGAEGIMSSFFVGVLGLKE